MRGKMSPEKHQYPRPSMDTIQQRISLLRAQTEGGTNLHLTETERVLLALADDLEKAKKKNRDLKKEHTISLAKISQKVDRLEKIVHKITGEEEPFLPHL